MYGFGVLWNNLFREFSYVSMDSRKIRFLLVSLVCFNSNFEFVCGECMLNFAVHSFFIIRLNLFSFYVFTVSNEFGTGLEFVRFQLFTQWQDKNVTCFGDYTKEKDEFEHRNNRVIMSIISMNLKPVPNSMNLKPVPACKRSLSLCSFTFASCVVRSVLAYSY